MKNKVLSIFSLIVFCLKLGAVIPQQDRANNLAAGYSQFPQNGNAQNREVFANTQGGTFPNVAQYQAANLQQGATTNQAGATTYNQYTQNSNTQNRESLAYQNRNYQNRAQYQRPQNLQNNRYYSYNTANNGVQNRYVQRPIPATGAFAYNYGGRAAATSNTQSNIRNDVTSTSQYNYGISNNNRGTYPGFNLKQLVRNEYGEQPIFNQSDNQPSNVQPSQSNVAAPGGHVINTEALEIPAYINAYSDTGEKLSSALEKVRIELEEILHSPGLTKIEEPIPYTATGNQYAPIQHSASPTTTYTNPQQSGTPSSTVPVNQYEQPIPTQPIIPSNESLVNSYPQPQQSVPQSNSAPLNQFEQPLSTRPYKPRIQQFGNPYRRAQQSRPLSAPINQYQQPKQSNVPTENQYQQSQQPISTIENQYEPQPIVPTENQNNQPQQPLSTTDNQYEPQPILPTENQNNQPQQPLSTTDNQYKPQQPIVPIENRYEPQQPIVPTENQYEPQQPIVPAENKYEPQQPIVPTENQYIPQQPIVPTENQYEPQQPIVPTENQYEPQQPIVPTENQYKPQEPIVPTENQYEPQQHNVPTENQYEPQEPIVPTENQYEPQEPIVPTENQYEPQQPIVPSENQYEPQQPIVPTDTDQYQQTHTNSPTEYQHQQPQPNPPTENQYQQPQQPIYPQNVPQNNQPVQQIPPVNNNAPQQPGFSPPNYPYNRQPPRYTLPLAPYSVNLPANEPTIPENPPQKRFKVLYPNGTVEYISESDLKQFVQQTQNVEVIRKTQPSNPETNSNSDQPENPNAVNNQQISSQDTTNYNSDKTNPGNDNTPLTTPNSPETVDEVILPTQPPQDIPSNDPDINYGTADNPDFNYGTADNNDNVKNYTVPITSQDNSNYQINEPESEDSEYEPEDHNDDSDQDDEDDEDEPEFFTPDVLYHVEDEPTTTTPNPSTESSTDYPYDDEEPDETPSYDGQPGDIPEDIHNPEPNNTEVPEVTTELNPKEGSYEKTTTTTPRYVSNDDNSDNYQQSSDIYSQNTKQIESEQQYANTTESTNPETSNIYYQKTVEIVSTNQDNNQNRNYNNGETTAQPVKNKRRMKKVTKVVRHRNGTVTKTTLIIDADDNQDTEYTSSPVTTTPIATTTAKPVTTTAQPVVDHRPRDIIITTSDDNSEQKTPDHPEDYVTIKPIIWLNKHDTIFWNKLKNNNTILNIVYQLQYSKETESLQPLSGIHRAVVLHGRSDDTTHSNSHCNCTPPA